MERLDFSLPEFTRAIWVSEKARDYWEPKFSEISRAWQVIERLAVAKGVKPAALQVCAPDNLPELSEWAVKQGLFCLPIQRQGTSDSYLNATKAYEEGKAWTYRVLIAPRSIAMYFPEAWAKGKDEEVGKFLGFPECCRKFFSRYWVGEGWRDLVVPMLGEEPNGYHRILGYLESNILLHRLGLRFVSHLPCSFQCVSSRDIGQKFREIGAKHGYSAEMALLSDILRWPIQYSTLHGVAIITTPVVRIVTSSTAIAEKVVIDKVGAIYPEYGAAGTVFPFQNSHPLVLHRTDGWTDNGFRSRTSMDAHHETVLRHVWTSLSEIGEQNPRVLDLGCGNGLLLEKIAIGVPEAVVCGVEISPIVFERASQRLTKRKANLGCASIFDFDSWNGDYALILIAEQRLEEALKMGIPNFEEVLRNRGKRVLVYNYENDNVRFL